jgi:hypothetical protein
MHAVVSQPANQTLPPMRERVKQFLKKEEICDIEAGATSLSYTTEDPERFDTTNSKPNLKVVTVSSPPPIIVSIPEPKPKPPVKKKEAQVLRKKVLRSSSRTSTGKGDTDLDPDRDPDLGLPTRDLHNNLAQMREFGVTLDRDRATSSVVVLEEEECADKRLDRAFTILETSASRNGMLLQWTYEDHSAGASYDGVQRSV